MELTTLTAISPVDGRYRSKTAPLADYFSEYALIRYRVRVEAEYFIALCELGLPQLKDVPQGLFEPLRGIYREFTPADAQRVKDHEAVTNHDVKAVEYFLKEEFDDMGLGEFKEFIHFGLTSQDINNTAVPLSIREALEDVVLPRLRDMREKLHALATEWADVAMLARTHGQPASPTRLGKEIEVYVYRLDEQLRMLAAIPHSGKFGGATGNFNAHRAAFPLTDWPAFAEAFLRDRLGLKRESLTTQISNYDNLAALFDALRRIGTVILDLDRDVELYSQTTKSLSGFRRIVEAIRERKRSGAFRYYDTICRQVANRMGHLREFARTHEVIVFVCGAKSSNGKALYEACREVNPRSYLSVNQDAIDPAWVEGARTIGICGATSTPSWLMNQVKIEEICTR